MAKKRIKTDAEEALVEQCASNDTERDTQAVQPFASEIPESVLETLRIFSNYPELQITPKGRVFTTSNKLAVTQGAILYKNPYYNL